MNLRHPILFTRTLPVTPRCQTGAVLIVALVLLAVLTLLGVTAMSTTSLEEKMAANTQEGNRVFQLAETGLAMAFRNGAVYDLGGATVAAQEIRLQDGSKVGQLQYRSQFDGWSPPPRNSLFSAAQFRAAHFDFQSDAETYAGGVATGIAARHHGGAYQIAPKP